MTSNPPPPANPLKNVSNVHIFPDDSPAELHGLISKTSAPSPGQILAFTQLKFDKLKLKKPNVEPLKYNRLGMTKPICLPLNFVMPILTEINLSPYRNEAIDDQ